MRFNITGLQETQRAMTKAVGAVKPANGLGRAVQFVGISAQRYMIGVTHVDTGAYRASQLIQYEGPARLRISVNPNARNPRTRALVSSYAPIEEGRGGDHAAYERTYNYARTALAPRAVSMLMSELP